MQISRTRCVGALVVAIVLVLAVGSALAAEPHKGWFYETSSTTSKVSVSFLVSRNGKKVTKLFAGDAFKCPSNIGGVGGFPGQMKSVSARISSRGTFKVKFSLIDPRNHKKAGTDTVTGTFLKHNRAKGKVKTHFNSNSGVCKATTRSFTAQGYRPVGG
jgi:hypothetical protein